jgi:hypothetical protein
MSFIIHGLHFTLFYTSCPLLSLRGEIGFAYFGCLPAGRQGWGIFFRLLFKNIKIAPAVGGALPPKRISFFLFAPFNFLFSETEKKLQCQKNQKLTKICLKKSTSGLSVDPWFVLYKLAKPFFFTAFQDELAAV